MPFAPLLRSLGALPLALLATLLLVWLMKSLIDVRIADASLQQPPPGLVYLPETNLQETRQDETRDAPERPSQPEPEPPEPPRPPDPEPLPEPLELALDEVTPKMPVVAPPPKPKPKPKPESKPESKPKQPKTQAPQPTKARPARAQSSSGGGLTDRPTYRPDPDYPSHAQRRGIEGTVTVRYTVTTDGQVTDATVVSASPSGIFERATLRAMRRWRYPPQATARTNVLATIRFELRGR